MKNIIVMLTAIFLMVPAVTSAHTHLETSNPKEGQVVKEKLNEIVLTFGTPIEELSKMTVTRDGNEVQLSEMNVENNEMTGSLDKPLENGSYVVNWNIVGEDGHPIEGQLTFSVETKQEEEETAKKEEKQTTENENRAEGSDETAEEQPETDLENEEESNENEGQSSLFTTVLIIVLAIVLIAGAGVLIKRKK
ncbi:copper resistance CopC family protein [Metabacillus arenae]|uniref:Copper resistance protein CopC n=1 Tax=Metabacillus arenae TaxID=2771434 RepID=A0A926S2Q2_9BACI|nr:copper resistance CopC family protein [Metabacillus arenae]MBD1382219.1 copper resistance protein CopC [Metabacillus arenae]